MKMITPTELAELLEKRQYPRCNKLYYPEGSVSTCYIFTFNSNWAYNKALYELRMSGLKFANVAVNYIQVRDNRLSLRGYTELMELSARK